MWSAVKHRFAEREFEPLKVRDNVSLLGIGTEVQPVDAEKVSGMAIVIANSSAKNPEKFQILLGKRTHEPYAHKLAIPGGRKERNENVDEAPVFSMRELTEEVRGFALFDDNFSKTCFDFGGTFAIRDSSTNYTVFVAPVYMKTDGKSLEGSLTGSDDLANPRFYSIGEIRAITDRLAPIVPLAINHAVERWLKLGRRS